LHEIQCQLPTGTSATGTTFRAGGGVKYKKWINLTGINNVDDFVAGFATLGAPA